jgi:hypothetical protein
MTSRARSTKLTKPLALLAAAAAGGAVGAFGLATVARAAPPESIPAACKQQLARALAALEPALSAPSRKIARGSKGTLEAAVAAYGAPRFHDVDEGALAPARARVTCPPEMASAGGRFCVDKWECSLLEKQPDGSTKPYTPYQPPEKDHVYIAHSAPNVVPQGYISAASAAAACKEAGKRLCHPVEWRAACGGSQAWAYPYGPAREAGKCNDSGAAPMLAYHAATMKRGWGMEELNDPRNNQLEGGLAKTGASPGCVNDYGAFDMVGNLDEWTADPNGTFQGGYWLDTSQHGEGCAYRTIAHGYTYHDYSTGFRCCKDPTPLPSSSASP